MSIKSLVVSILGIGLVVAFIRWKGLKFNSIPETPEAPIESQIDLPKLAQSLLTPNPVPTSSLTQEWQQVAEGVEIKAIPYDYNGSSYQIQVIKIVRNRAHFSLEYSQEGKTISQWAKGSENSIIMNAGFFKEKNEPVGLLYIQGRRIDSHRVNPSNTGLLVLKNKEIEILNLANTPMPEDAKLQDVLQTYPILIDKDKVVVSSARTTQDRRTAIGLDKENNVYLLTAEYQHLGLYDFAKKLEDSGLQLTEVLNLDGGGSTGISLSFGEFQKTIESETAVPTVLFVKL